MVTFSGLTYTGTPDASEVLGAKLTIARANQAIAALNVALAAQDPPGTPLPLWPSGTNAETKASYLGIRLQDVANLHVGAVNEAASQAQLSEYFTEAQLQTIRQNFISRRQAGETAAALVTDSAA